MITMEQIDELRKRKDVSYEEAKEALEYCNGDILEAIIYIERKGSTYSEDKGQEGRSNFSEGNNEASNKDCFSESVGNLINWIKKVFRKGNRNHLVIEKNQSVVLKLSLTIMVLITVLVPYIAIPLLIIALFTGHKFVFQGEDIEKTKVNETMEKMSKTAEDIKMQATKE